MKNGKHMNRIRAENEKPEAQWTVKYGLVCYNIYNVVGMYMCYESECVCECVYVMYTYI